MVIDANAFSFIFSWVIQYATVRIKNNDLTF